MVERSGKRGKDTRSAWPRAGGREARNPTAPRAARTAEERRRADEGCGRGAGGKGPVPEPEPAWDDPQRPGRAAGQGPPRPLSPRRARGLGEKEERLLFSRGPGVRAPENRKGFPRNPARSLALFVVVSRPAGGGERAPPPRRQKPRGWKGKPAFRPSLMILPQVHLRKPCYDFYFL